MSYMKRPFDSGGKKTTAATCVGHNSNEKKLKCDRCENVHSCKCVREILREIRARANQLANFNNILANDHQVAIRRVVALETALQSARRSQNPNNPRVLQQLSESENIRRLQTTEIARLKQRLLSSETERGMQHANIAALKLRLRESENIRFGGQQRAQEMQHGQNIALRRNPTVGTQPPPPPPPLPPPPLNPGDPFLHDVLEETRADADELADENEELVTDFEGARRRIALLENTLNISRRLQNAEILGLRQRLRESETARNRAIQRVGEMQLAHNIAQRQRNIANTALSTERPRARNILEETRADAYELADENEALASDFEAVRNRVAELEVALSSSRRSRMAENGQLNQQLRESEAARIAAIQRVEEMQRARTIALRQAEMMNVRLNTERPRAQGILEETRVEADELADENEELAADNESGHRQVMELHAELGSTNLANRRLTEQLRRSESARHVVVGRAEELQRMHGAALRQANIADAALNTERPRARSVIEETRAEADELEDENDALATDFEVAHNRVLQLETALESTRRSRNAENHRLNQQLRDCEAARTASVRRVEELQREHNIALRRLQIAEATLNVERPRAHNMLEETRAGADELADENEALASDFDASQNRITELEAALESSRRSQNIENVRLSQRLQECESARIAAIRRMEEMQRAHNVALRQANIANVTLNTERPRALNILEQTRAGADEVADEKEALLADLDATQSRVAELVAALESSQQSRNMDNLRLNERLRGSETARLTAVRRAEELQRALNVALRRANAADATINTERPRALNILEETQSEASELARENDALKAECDSARRQIMELQSNLESTRQSQNVESRRLSGRLRESENARITAVRRAEELEQARNVALRRTEELHRARNVALRRADSADAALNEERPRARNMLEETRAGAYELEDENKALASVFEGAQNRVSELEATLESSRRSQHVENTRLNERLRESENARLAAVRRTEELQRAHNIALRRLEMAETTLNTERPRAHNMLEETRAGADELENENEALASDFDASQHRVLELEAALESSRRSQNAENGRLNQQLRESETARIAAIRRVEELQRAHAVALRRLEMTEATLNTERPRARSALEETRAGASELADENEALVADYEASQNRVAELEAELESSSRSQHSEIVRLNQQLRDSEAARIATTRQVEELQRAHSIALRRADIADATLNAERPLVRNMLEETRAGASELADENEVLATDFETSQNRVLELESTLESLRHSHNAENIRLNQQLRESEAARNVAISRVEEMQRAHNIALHQAEMANVRLNTERPRAQSVLEETRAGADELANENEALAADFEDSQNRVAELEAALESSRHAQHSEIARFNQQLRDSEAARNAALRRVEELQQAHIIALRRADAADATLNAELPRSHDMLEETRAGADELVDENEALATNFEAARNRIAELESELESSRRSQNAENIRLNQQLRECEAARITANRRVDEMQHAHNIALRRAEMANATLNAERPRARSVLEEVRTEAEDFADENEELAADNESGHRQVIELHAELESTSLANRRLTEQLRQSESARHMVVGRLEELQRLYDAALYRANIADVTLNTERPRAQNVIEETRAEADELEKENDALMADCEAARRRVAELESTVESIQRSRSGHILQLNRRCHEGETARRVLHAENVQLKRQLGESLAARLAITRRAEMLQQSCNLAHRQTTAIRVAAERAINMARTKMQELRQANVTLNVRCGSFMREQARLIASLASVGHKLEVARNQGRMMRRMARMMSTMPPKEAIEAIRAARAEAKEARIRERGLAFAKSAVEHANRAERHRREYEEAFREQATQSLAAKAKDSDEAFEKLRSEYRSVVLECATMRRKYEDAKEDGRELRTRVKKLERTNSSLAVQLGTAGEAARAASIELNIAEESATQMQKIIAKVARLRARCGELVATRCNEGTATHMEEDIGEDGRICVICMDVMTEGESVIRLNSSRVFHSDCITQCLSRMREPRCPIDQTPVTVQIDELIWTNWSESSRPQSEQQPTTTA